MLEFLMKSHAALKCFLEKYNKASMTNVLNVRDGHTGVISALAF